MKTKASTTYLISILALSSIHLICQPANAALDVDKKLAEARALIDKGRAKPAATILRAVTRSQPKNAEAHMQLGAALAAMVENDKYDEAIQEEQLAIKLDPSSSGAHRILGMIYANQGKHDEAISNLTQACKLNPNSFAARRDLGTALMAAGKIDDALFALKKAVELKPDNIGAHIKLARVYTEKKQYKEAMDEVSKAIKIDSSKAESHLLLANMKLESGDAAGSIEHFKNAIAANGYDALGCKNPLTAASAFSGLGAAMAAEKSTDQARLSKAYDYQKKAIKAHPGFLPAYLRSAELLERQNKPKEAESVYQNIFKATHNEGAVAIPYAQFLSKQGRKEEAGAVLKKVLEKSPKNKAVQEALTAIEKSPGKAPTATH